MNKTYRLVFNHALGAIQVAPEIAGTDRGRRRTLAARTSSTFRRLSIAISLAVTTMAHAPTALAQQFARVFEGDNTISSDADYSRWGFIVANTNNGHLTINNGATVTSAKMFLGQEAGTIGALLVTGPGSNIVGTNSSYADAIVGNAGNGRIDVALGGQITNQHFWTLGNLPGSDGQLNIQGPGSLVQLHTLRSGEEGHGAVNISNGGKLTVSAFEDNPVIFARQAGSEGHLDIQGKDSILEAANGSIRIGERGAAAMSVTDGGRILANGNLILAAQDQSRATATVSGTGTELSLGGLTVGGNGTASMQITDGASITASKAPSNGITWLNIGEGGNGRLLLDGHNTRLNNNGGMFMLGAGGQAELTIRNGASVVLGGGDIAAKADARSKILVTGAGSRLETTPDSRVSLGSPGHAILEIDAGGMAIFGNLQLSDASVASNTKPSSRSEAVISGAGSKLEVVGELKIGTSTQASFIAEKGATVTAGEVWFERASGTFGARTSSAFTIRDPGTTFTASGPFNVSHHFNLENGAVLNSQNASVRINSPYLFGETARISGVQTHWSNTENLYVNAPLQIRDGAQVDTDTLTLDGSRYLNGNHLGLSELHITGADSKLTINNTTSLGSTTYQWPWQGYLIVSNGGQLQANGRIDFHNAGGIAFGAGFQIDSEGNPTHAAAQAPGRITPEAPLIFTTINQSRNKEKAHLLFNHTASDLMIANPMASTQLRHAADNYDGIQSISGTTRLTGDMSRFMHGIDVNGGRLIIDGAMNNTEEASDPLGSLDAEQGIRITGGELILNGISGYRPADGSDFATRLTHVDASNGGILGGAGTIIGNIDIADGGQLSPGDDGIGTMTIDGQLDFGARASERESILNIDVRGDSSHDLLAVRGQVRLGWQGAPTAVAVTALDPATSYQNGQNYTILTSDREIQGTFGRAFSKSAFLTPTLSYTPTSVILGIKLNADANDALIVEADQTFAGNGHFDSIEVRNGGSLSPGPLVGAISASGPVSFAGGSFYDVDVRADGGSDQIVTTGAATLSGGTVRVTGLDPAGSYHDGQSYTILSAESGVNGAFSDAIARSAFLIPRLHYTPTSTILTISLQSEGGGGSDPGDDGDGNNDDGGDRAPPAVFTTVADSANQHGVAEALDTLPQTGAALALYNQMLMLSAEEARASYDRLSGEIHAANRSMLLDGRFISDGIARRMDGQVMGEERSGIMAWVTGNSGSTRIDSDQNGARNIGNRHGLLSGADLALSEHWRLGASIGMQKITGRLDHRQSRADTNAKHVGLYASGAWGRLSIHGGISHAWYTADIDRHVIIPGGLHDFLRTTYDSRATNTFARLSWQATLSDITLMPYLALSHTRLRSDGSLENGGDTALMLASSKDDLSTATLGAQASWDMGDTFTTGATLDAGLAWQHARGDLRTASRATLLVGGKAFTAHATPLARNSVIGELNVSIPIAIGNRLQGGISGRFGNGQRDASVYLSWLRTF